MNRITCIRPEADLKQIERCHHALESRARVLEEMAANFNLAGNVVRLKILFLLQKERALCVCDLSDILEMKIPAVSQHLRKLKDKSLVQTERSGQIIYYSVTRKFSQFFSSFSEVFHFSLEEATL